MIDGRPNDYADYADRTLYLLTRDGRDPWPGFENDLRHLFPPLGSAASVTSAAFYPGRTLLKTGCRLLCLPRASEKPTLLRHSLLTLMIDHFDLIIGHDSIGQEWARRPLIKSLRSIFRTLFCKLTWQISRLLLLTNHRVGVNLFLPREVDTTVCCTRYLDEV